MIRPAAVAAIAVLLSAPMSSAQRAGSGSGQLSTSDQIKATGCVAKDSDGNFTLSNAAIEVEPYFGPGGASAKGTPKPLATKTTFILQSGTNLGANLGHKIKVIGQVAPVSASSADSVQAPAPAGPEGRGGRGGGTQRMYVPRLNVRSIEIVSDRCQ